jgi:uncharacterized protein DUF4154
VRTIPHPLRSLVPWLGPLLAFCLIFFTGRVVADDVAVPISLQVELLLKVASYDRNLKARAGDQVRIAVLIHQEDADSGRSAAQALKALADVEDIDGLPVERLIMTYTDAAALARQTNEGSLSILYVMPGFDDSEMASIAQALDGVSVLSAGALAKYTAQGVVLGFDLAGGKPKLLVNLERARRQHVELSSSVLKLMRVVE